MLFINDSETQLSKLDFFFQQCVRADEYLEFAATKSFVIAFSLG